FQAEDGIRGRNVTGVKSCALPILVNCTEASPAARSRTTSGNEGRYMSVVNAPSAAIAPSSITSLTVEERRRAGITEDVGATGGAGAAPWEPCGPFWSR